MTTIASAADLVDKNIYSVIERIDETTIKVIFR